MRLLIQRVQSAEVDTADRSVSIGRGAVVFFGSHREDKIGQVSYLAKKLIHIRMFSDAADRMNLSLLDVEEAVLIDAPGY